MLLISVFIIVILAAFLIHLSRGGENMVDMYVALVIAGRRNIDTVPVKFQKEVLADLNALGLDGYGNQLQPAQ